MAMNRLLTTTEAAELLRVSGRTVLNWIERDAIPYVTLPQAGDARKQYRIPLYGLLSSLEGTYDLSRRVHELDEAVSSARLDPPEDQERAEVLLETAGSTADEAIEHLHAEAAG